MLIDRQVKIYYADSDYPVGWENIGKENRDAAKTADIIISRDGKVVKDRFAGYNYKD